MSGSGFYGGTPFAQSAEPAARELIDRMREFALSVGEPLGEWDLWALAQPLNVLIAQGDEYGEARMQAALSNLNNRAVSLIRRSVEFEKRRGDPSIKVRRGLRLPVWWEDRYERIYSLGLEWYIAAVLQNAFLGNPLAGESRPWNSR